MTLAHYAGHNETEASVTPDRDLLADLGIGEMLALLHIAGTADARRAASVLAHSSGGLLKPSREAFMRITVRGLARLQGNGYMLTLRGQFVGAALIGTIEKRAE